MRKHTLKYKFGIAILASFLVQGSLACYDLLKGRSVDDILGKRIFGLIFSTLFVFFLMQIFIYNKEEKKLSEK